MAVPSSKSSPSSFDASAFDPVQKRHVVGIGLKVDTLDALRSKEHRRFRCSPLGTVDGGYDTQIRAGLVFLQDRLSGPLTRARRGDAPVSLSGQIVFARASPRGGAGSPSVRAQGRRFSMVLILKLAVTKSEVAW